MIARRKLGARGLKGVDVSVLGFGGCPLGNMYTAMTEETAKETVEAAVAAGIRYFDTSPFYGLGLSEERLGRYLRLPNADRTIVSTKIGRVLDDCPPSQIPRTIFVDTPPRTFRFDYTYDGVMRSYEQSLRRLQMDRIDILLVHDVDVVTHGTWDAAMRCIHELMTSGYRALDELRRAGDVSAIGAGVDEWEICEVLAQSGDFDCFLLAGRYTLLDQSALASFLPLCEQRGIDVILGGPFNSGILASGAVTNAKYDYQAAPDAVRAKVSAIDLICRAHGIDLKRVALQFPLLHPAIVSVIPGVANAEQLRANVAAVANPVPADLWNELKAKALLRSDAPV